MDDVLPISEVLSGEVAARIRDDHRSRRPFVPFAESSGIATPADAYRVQRDYVTLQIADRRTSPAGYKIGLTSKGMQEMCRIDSPVYGVILADGVKPTGCVLQAADFGRLGLEFEIAVRLGADLVPHELPFEAGEVSAAIDAVAPAIELVDDRRCVYASLGVLSLIADNAWNAGMVHAAFVPPTGELASICGTVFADGVSVGQGHGGDVLGHPFVALTWLANQLRSERRFLRAGDYVMTGTIVRTLFPSKTTRLRFDLEGLGVVDCTVVLS